jgi:hypothetical protein
MDSMSLRFVYAAFATTWVVIAAYAFHVHVAVRRARAAYERSQSVTRETR